MNVLQAIGVINRRAKTIYKLFGMHSDIYEEFTLKMAEYDFKSTAQGVFKLNANKANKAEYRKLTAWAKQIKKTPYSVLKRQADKIKEQIKDNEPFFDDIYDGQEIADLNTYYKWLDTFSSFFESCYELATMNGYEGTAAYQYAKELYDNENEYNKQWNYFYNAGAFDEFKEKEKLYTQEQILQEYNLNEETGELLPKDDFYGGL